MADSETAQRVQFGEDINPVKTATSNVYNKDYSLSEKNGFDVEDRAMQIANADLNQKKKQVSSFNCFSRLWILPDEHFQLICQDLYRMVIGVACISKYVID